MEDLVKRINETVSFLKSKVDVAPQIAIILGTGLGALAEKVEEKRAVDYDDIPHFAKATVVGHKGKLVFGKIAGKKIVAMEGRFHYYEGHTLDEVTYPVRIMRALGAEVLILSGAVGAMNPKFSAGELVVITDHINLMGINPLIGPNVDELGPRFPDMSQPYDRELIELTEKMAREEKIKVHKGVYIGVTGPNLETAAEYKLMRMLGADVVGMSTVPEVIVAVHAGFRTLGVSCITDMCLPDKLKPADINEIIRIANEAEPKLTHLVFKVIEKL